MRHYRVGSYDLHRRNLNNTNLFFFFFFFFFFLSGGKWRDMAMVTNNHHYVVHGPYFDPMTPPLGVLKSQSRTSTHLGSIPGQVPTVLPL